MRECDQDGAGFGRRRTRRWLLGAASIALGGLVAGEALAAPDASTRLAPGASPAASPTPAIPDASAFMLLRNTGEVPDRLIAAMTDAAGSVVLRTFDDSTGTRREILGPVDVAIPVGRTIALAPGEPQLRLRDVKRVLPPNTWYALTLVFQRAGTIVVPVNVRWGGAPIIANINRANRYTSGGMTVVEPWAFPAGQEEIVTPIPGVSPDVSPAPG